MNVLPSPAIPEVTRIVVQSLSFVRNLRFVRSNRNISAIADRLLGFTTISSLDLECIIPPEKELVLILLISKSLYILLSNNSRIKMKTTGKRKPSIVKTP